MLLLTLAFFLSGVLAAGKGKWGSTINFPIVPVAGAVNPGTGQLVVWSAYSARTFGTNVQNVTQTAVWNPADGSVQQFAVDCKSNTNPS
jgi:galactose oxidase